MPVRVEFDKEDRRAVVHNDEWIERFKATDPPEITRYESISVDWNNPGTQEGTGVLISASTGAAMEVTASVFMTDEQLDVLIEILQYARENRNE